MKNVYKLQINNIDHLGGQRRRLDYNIEANVGEIMLIGFIWHMEFSAFIKGGKYID